MQKMKKIKIIAQLFIMASFLCFFFLFAFSRFKEISSLNNEITSLKNEIVNEEAVGARLQDELGYSQSDAFIEKAARERLGLIKYDEIIFVIDK